MPKRSRSRPPIVDSTPQNSDELTSLISTLTHWIHGGVAAVPVLPNLDAAAAAVAAPINSGEVSYAESLNGWWAWHSAAKAETASSSDATTFASLHKQILEYTDEELRRLNNGDHNTMQLARLPSLDKHAILDDIGLELFDLLSRLRPRADGVADAQKAAALLADQVEDDDGPTAEFYFRWLDSSSGGSLCLEPTGKGKRGFVKLVRRLCECARLGTRAISLSVRVRRGTALHRACAAIALSYGMSADNSEKDLGSSSSSTAVCPPSRWSFGPPTQRASVISEADEETRVKRLPHGDDARFYLLLGSPGAYTSSHWDRGVQAVLYHTVAGSNAAVAVPRKIALMLQAVSEALPREMSHWEHALEQSVLSKVAESSPGLLAAGAFDAGETMLIVPGGGHAVLTGDPQGKVIVAGEWHLNV